MEPPTRPTSCGASNGSSWRPTAGPPTARGAPSNTTGGVTGGCSSPATRSCASPGVTCWRSRPRSPPPSGAFSPSASVLRPMAIDPAELGKRLREGDRSAAPAALNVIENRADRDAAAALLAQVSPAELGHEAGAHLVGVTGPPGAGKSMLLSALLSEWRRLGRTVAVLAVDPSSKRSGGSLLGDRARIEHDPKDEGILIRSTAAGGRLGGLAAPTREAATALAPAFDLVVVETVGVGQSETDVEEVCDTTAVVVQPASGDTLQFLKAGIMEVPDVLVVTKADLGQPALRAQRDLRAALRSLGSSEVPVMAVSSVSPPSGITELADALDAPRDRIDVAERRLRARRASP